MAVRIYADASWKNRVAAIAVFQAGREEPLEQMVIPFPVDTPLEAELGALFMAAELAPPGAVLHTDSAQAHALVEGRQPPPPKEDVAVLVEAIQRNMREKGLILCFIGGKRRRRRRRHRELHRLVDSLAKSLLRSQLAETEEAKETTPS